MKQESIDVEVRLVRVQDARALLGLSQQIGQETSYMTFGAEGFNLSVEEEVDHIESYLASENSILLVTEIDEQLVGLASLSGQKGSRLSHVAEVGVCLIEEYWGYGLGTMMIEMLLEFAENSPLRVLTLEVVADNHAAIQLYKKFGFQEIGIGHKRLNAQGIFYDVLMMEKVL